MADALFMIAKSNPDYLKWIVKYLRVWWHDTIYDGREGEVGGEGSVRYLAQPAMIHCCLITENLIILGQKLNMTVEFVELKGEDLGRLTYLEKAMELITEDEADVLDTQTLSRYAQWHATADSFDMISTQPYWEMYKMAAVVPKHRTVSGFFQFLSAFPPSAWAVLLLALLLYAFVQAVKEVGLKAAFKRWRHCLFEFYRYSLGDFPQKTSPKNQNILVMSWSFCVSLVIAELLCSEYFTQMTVGRKSWPETFKEIYESRDQHDFIGTNTGFFEETGIEEIKNLKERTKTVPMSDPLGIARKMKNGTTVMFSETTNVESFQGLINPDKFAYLDEKYLLSQDVFLVAKRFEQHKVVLEITQRLVETGFVSLNFRPTDLIPLILRATDPTCTKEFLEMEDEEEITLDDTKGIFICLLFGNGLAVLLHLKNSRKIRKKKNREN